MKERVDEIGAEQDGDAQAENGFEHELLLSQSSAETRIGSHQRKEDGAEAKIDEVEHGSAP
jgi:hypothetical protein